jgi:hypothetical protein
MACLTGDIESPFRSPAVSRRRMLTWPLWMICTCISRSEHNISVRTYYRVTVSKCSLLGRLQNSSYCYCNAKKALRTHVSIELVRTVCGISVSWLIFTGWQGGGGGGYRPSCSPSSVVRWRCFGKPCCFHLQCWRNWFRPKSKVIRNYTCLQHRGGLRNKCGQVFIQKYLQAHEGTQNLFRG